MTRSNVDTRDVRPEPQLDALLGIEACRTQRDPLFRRVAGQIVLGQVGPINGRRILTAQHDDATFIVLAPQLLGGGEARRPAADDHDLRRRSVLRHSASSRYRRWRFLLGAHEDLAVAHFGRPARDRAERRSVQGFPGPQAEARVVPRTANGVVDHDALRQRAAVMRTRGADREELIAAAREQHGFVSDMAGEHLAVGQLLHCDTQGQVGTRVS